MSEKKGKVAFRGTAHSDQRKKSRNLDVVSRQAFQTYTNPF
jgi:hypothetical protein